MWLPRHSRTEIVLWNASPSNKFCFERSLVNFVGSQIDRFLVCLAYNSNLPTRTSDLFESLVELTPKLQRLFSSSSEVHFSLLLIYFKKLNIRIFFVGTWRRVKTVKIHITPNKTTTSFSKISSLFAENYTVPRVFVMLAELNVYCLPCHQRINSSWPPTWKFLHQYRLVHLLFPSFLPISNSKILTGVSVIQRITCTLNHRKESTGTLSTAHRVRHQIR